MMTKTSLQIGSSCYLVRTVWETLPTDVCLEYTEHSSDPWYSDNETSIDIDAGLAREIIAFLSVESPT